MGDLTVRELAIELAALRREGEVHRKYTDEARGIQATEYERRLSALNHENERISLVLASTVSQEIYDAYVASEREKVEVALKRTDEKFADYITRADARLTEIDRVVAALKAAAERDAAVQVAAARTTRDAVESQGRRIGRYMAIAGLALAIIVAASNYLVGH